MFSKLRGAIPKPHKKEHHRQDWIYLETWSLIDTRTDVLRQGDQRNARDLTCAIKTALQGDRSRQAAEAGSEVKYLLASDPNLIHEAWIRIQGWYKDAVDQPPPLDRVALAKMMAEREELYRHVPSPGYPIPVGEPPFPFLVDDSIPEDEDITWAV